MRQIGTLPAIIVIVFVLTSCSSSPPADVRSYPVQISNIGAAVNSAMDEFAPGITANGLRMIFTRGSTTPPYNRDFYESALVGDFWKRPAKLTGNVNTDRNEGSPSFTADGQTLFYAASDRPDGLGKSDIYRAELEGMDWRAGENPGFPVNTRAWESHPSISPDGNTLYFVSDREGGYGGLDIWVTSRDSEGFWRVPVNMGPEINTPGDEVSPCIASDGVTLYFASDGHPGLGGTDMFVSRHIGEKWTSPTNLGRPLNSEQNDEFFALAAEGKTVYFSSRRDGGFGGYDIYRAEPNPFPPGAVVVLSGTVRDKRTRVPLVGTMILRDVATGERISSHKSNAYSGEYLIVLQAGAVYEVEVRSGEYLPETSRFDLINREAYGEIEHDFLLQKEYEDARLEATVTADVLDFSVLRGSSGHRCLRIEEMVTRETMPLLNYVFFDEGRSTLPPRYAQLSAAQATQFTISSLPEGAIERYYHLLNIIGLRMRQRQHSSITLTGTTDGSEPQRIAETRAQAVADYLNDVWDIERDRMRLVSRTLPEAASSSRSAEGRAENRRVEITSADSELLTPIESSDVERILEPSSVRFYPSITAEAGLSRWKFEVGQGTRVLRDSDGYTTYPDSIVWNWRDLEGDLPDGDTLRFTLYARDAEGSEVRTEPQSIPVQLLTLDRQKVERLPGRTIEKISLILFDFDRADLGERNREILRNAAGRLHSQATMVIRGHTDAMGETAYNLRLSERRALAVKNELQGIVPEAATRAEGVGESVFLFDNTFPEGRFYCRTVQILIETIE
ncbi:MAG: PD40 domain-containing protein [Bacteroidetes bacterium]|nr:PD40 domain-containing protein [Bacteroidota bacterium]